MSFKIFVKVVAIFTCFYSASALSYRKATEGSDVVKRKLYPKKGTIELNGPNFGAILNQSYISTLLFHGGLTYHTSETWGFGVEVAMASNSDKTERSCIESFINKFEDNVDGVCLAESDESTIFTKNVENANVGPAYVPIREIESLIAATAIWNPVYGKQLFFLSGVGHFDVYTTMGLGLAMSKYYPKKTTFDDGTPLRGPLPATGSGSPKPGTAPENTDLWGVNGRPAFENQSTPMFTLGVGQKFHFFKRFNLKMEIRNYTLLGTEAGFDTFFAVWGGIGLRF